MGVWTVGVEVRVEGTGGGRGGGGRGGGEGLDEVDEGILQSGREISDCEVANEERGYIHHRSLLGTWLEVSESAEEYQRR